MLSDFEGTILLVSHDRFLIDALATQIWEVDAQTSHLVVFEGSYSDYKEYLQRENQAKSETPDRKYTEITLKELSSESKTGLSKNERLRLEQKLKSFELEISRLENEQKNLEEKLQNPPPDGNLILKIAEDYERIRRQLQSSLDIWEEIAGKLEE
jgi:ATP-binding cassette subfamily F protein 3